MLNSDFIHSKISNIESCTSEDAVHFSTLIDLYPFSSSFSILYLKSLANSKDIRLQAELEKHAFRIQSRSILYDLLTNSKELDSTISVNNIEREEDSEIIFTEEETAINSPLVEEIETRDEELEKQILAAAFSDNYVDTILDQKEPELEELVINADEIVSFPNEDTSVKFKPKEKDLSPKSFGSWLKLVQNNSSISEVEEEEETKKEFYTFDKPKKEFFSPAKTAKQSIDSNKMPVSETLAKIFILQGNYPKAIYVFEQLSLINPEKKTYFASQIKLIKKKNNL